MRKLTQHQTNGLNEALQITVCDQPGPGGANHHYELLQTALPPTDPTRLLEIRFQKGPIAEAGINGNATNEALIAVAIDRLCGFQFKRKEDGTFDREEPGPFSHKENATALSHLEKALAALRRRTAERTARGVEGTSQP